METNRLLCRFVFFYVVDIFRKINFSRALIKDYAYYAENRNKERFDESVIFTNYTVCTLLVFNLGKGDV